ncbi:MAG: type II secretion system protein GspG [Bdellovibrionota bacterium]|nr:MAG: prepilin-type N-terminal cleavage/methylation domain-containing protein [Pseudomonadota bacterium]
MFKGLIRHLRLSKSTAVHPDPQAGMTIIEILIVIALIGTIMTIVISNTMKHFEDSKIDLTKIAQTNLKSALALYKVNVNQFPGTEPGLRALLTKPENAKGWRGPYVESKDNLNDAWGEEMTYERVAANVYKIISAGPDNVVGTDDDIIFPDLKGNEDEKPISTELNIPRGQANP